MIEVNSVVYVKATDEPVYVKSIDLEGLGLAYVRRSVQTDQGIMYQDDTFELPELVTEEQRLTREMESQLMQLRLKTQYGEMWEKEKAARTKAQSAKQVFDS